MAKFSNKYEVVDDKVDHKHDILKNKLNIIDKIELEHAETDALIYAYERLAKEYSETHMFTENDVCYIHKVYLGNIYEWAGKYRTVDLSSENIRWCHAQYIESEMEKFSKLLSDLTPFKPYLSRKEILQRLAKLHGELIIIHPFRDGNGRTTRLLSDLFLLQANYEIIQKGVFDNEDIRKEYHNAIQEVWSKVDYSRLVGVFDLLVS